MKKFLKFLPLIVIPLALVAALYLVRQEQETRKSAAGVDVSAGLHGALTNNDQNMTAKMTLDVGSDRLVAFAIKFKYTSDTLDFNSVDLHPNFSGDDPDLDVGRVIRKETDTSGEVELVALSYDGVTGSIGLDNPLVTLKFDVVGEGEAKVWVDEAYDHYQFARQGGDHLLNLSGDLEVSQTITGPTATPTNTPVPTNTPKPTATNTPKPTATDVPAECSDGEKDCGGVNNRPRECVDGQWALRAPCGTGMVCENGQCVEEDRPTATQPPATATEVPPTATSGPEDCHPCDTHAQGDANCDGEINNIDIAIWIEEMFAEQEKEIWQADFNCDNVINNIDLTIWIEGMFANE